MGDMGDYYRDMRKYGQSKRAMNRKTSSAYLEKRDIPFSYHNNGAHLIVEGPTCFIDFWPGTGKWKTRDGDSGFGVRNLVDYINNKVLF